MLPMNTYPKVFCFVGFHNFCTHRPKLTFRQNVQKRALDRLQGALGEIEWSVVVSQVVVKTCLHSDLTKLHSGICKYTVLF